jgi:hypothetical protein
MDWEYALYQMACLAALAPSRVYRTTRYHRQTKKQWSRDDPAFLVSFTLLFLGVGLIIGFVYSGWSLWTSLRFSGSVVFGCLGAASVALCTFTFLIANRFLIDPMATYNLDSWTESEHMRVEWLYAFDVHCNALFGGVFLPLVIAQSGLHTLLVRSRLSSCLLHLYSVVYYWYIVWLGYDILPFLRHSQVFLAPIPILSALLLAVTVMGEVNLTAWTWEKLLRL